MLRVAEGNEEAFSHLFHHYRGKLYHYILTITDSREAAEDTVHDVFLRLWEGRTSLPSIERLSPYLYRMCHNRAISGLRRMAKETLILAELRQEGLPLIPDADPTSQKEVLKFIQRAVDQLSPQQRKVFMLSRQDGLKHEEIADRLGISVNTVRTHLGAALRFLREEIGRAYGPMATAIWVVYQLS